MTSNQSIPSQAINYKPEERQLSQRTNARRPIIKPTYNDRVYPASTETQSLGSLQVSVTSSTNNRPIENATIQVALLGDPQNVLEELTTSATGRTSTVELPTPPLDYSLTPAAPMPYSEYALTIRAIGYEPIIISGAQILPTRRAIQNVVLDPLPSNLPGTAESFPIADHTLYGIYPPKILEPEVKPVESNEIVLSSVVIPEFVIVHDGPPSDTTATNYWVRYRDYIKNVASSEIYATWPEQTIYDNVLAIQ